MEEKGFRIVKCPNRKCPKKIKINITEKNYGKNGRVTCLGCGEIFTVKIPVPENNASFMYITNDVYV